MDGTRRHADSYVYERHMGSEAPEDLFCRGGELGQKGAAALAFYRWIPGPLASSTPLALRWSFNGEIMTP